MSDERWELTAIEVAETHGMRIEPAPPNRAWMSQTPSGFARRCLPMLLANQHGWVLTCPADVSVQWDGSSGPDAMAIAAAPDTHPDALPVSHFGEGILTWRLPFLFHTPDDVNLLLRGPANLPKDGVSALEGLIEADWSPATATMNWMVTRARHPVTFVRGEPIGMIVPVPRGLLDEVEPRQEPLQARADLAEHYVAWRDGREELVERLDPATRPRDRWQGDYFRGQVADRKPTGSREHQRRLRLLPFTRPEEAGD